MKVFISSTLIDLKEYRKEAEKAILDAGMEPILFEKIQAGENWNNEIKSAIDSADIFLMIIGFRLGSINNNKAWIEKEYEIAIQIEKPILSFMLSDDAPIITSEIDSNLNDILKFRNSIKEKFLVQLFSTPKEIYQSILISLTRIGDSIKVVSDTAEERLNEIKKKDFIEHKTVRILKLLLSSPGDVSAERELVAKAVFRFNQEYLIDKGVFIKLIRWEDFAPQIGDGPQRIINKQLELFDIFIGLMWNRFGTPTDLAASGTEEEFNGALISWQKHNRPWIAFYFCDRPANFRTAYQLEQKAKVIEFREKLTALGLVKPYDYLEVFENTILLDLIKITDQYLK
jgi:hypothetical protein